MDIRCRLHRHKWGASHTLSVWRADLGRTVRVWSKACYRCGYVDEHVIRQKAPIAPFVADDQ
jgi:hypothetical protein